MIMTLSPPLLLAGLGAVPASSTTAKIIPLEPLTCIFSPFFLSSSKFELRKRGTFCQCSCTPKNGVQSLLESFSVLSQDIPWDTESTWSTFVAYILILHIPLSFGGLSIVARVLHLSDLDPLTRVASVLALQTTELAGVLAFLYHTSNQKHKLTSYFLGTCYSKERNWIKATALGIGLLSVLVFLTSMLADRLIGPQHVNNPILKEILLHSPVSKATCFFLYCVVAPLLEETVYRGFLFTSLASKTKLWQAVCLASFAFSLSHFSLENSVQLFIIGFILASVYSWSGNLLAPLALHSLYNALILLYTMIS
ncbi:hypothetical protein HPP92_025720 [Vanilla planifolia]|uniref:CAAX prenyl protease 2/Lysostaphin resistance protein A-like domain-containing protein n=1 Tax=Vanilla planifolia TaxID=51239 RepID=A0A835PID5_VANPL|nr:hypothetical protein HPP92_025720 [Vanilla planifolia]